MKIWNFMNGLKMKTYTASTCFMLLSFSMPTLFAGEQNANEEIPSIEFLEFIGEWETEQGEWIDPVEFENEEVDSLIDTSLESETEYEN